MAQRPPMARRGVPDTNAELTASAAGPITDDSDELIDMSPPRMCRDEVSCFERVCCLIAVEVWWRWCFVGAKEAASRTTAPNKDDARRLFNFILMLMDCIDDVVVMITTRVRIFDLLCYGFAPFWCRFAPLRFAKCHFARSLLFAACTTTQSPRCSSVGRAASSSSWRTSIICARLI